jgi:hypothetical protein
VAIVLLFFLGSWTAIVPQLEQSGEDNDEEKDEEYEENGILDYEEELPLKRTSPSKMMHEQRYVSFSFL